MIPGSVQRYTTRIHNGVAREYRLETGFLRTQSDDGVKRAVHMASSTTQLTAQYGSPVRLQGSTLARSENLNQAPQLPADTLEAAPSPEEIQGDAQYQKYKRMGTDATLLALGDIPAGVSIAVGLNMLPGLNPYSDVINAVNALTGYLGLASDLSVARDCISNPDAGKLDKAVDAAHIGTAFISTGSSMVPLLASLNNPVAMGVFVGGQVLGTVADAAKAVWDYKRGGHQSSRHDANKPERLVLDNFEKKMARIPLLVGTLAAENLAFPHAVHFISATLAAPLTAMGGACGAVYGFTQARKSSQLGEQLQNLKAQGVTEFEMPSWSRKGLKTYTVTMDEAISTVKRRQIFGWGQVAGSALLMAAGCISCPPLAVAGLVMSTAVGVSAIGSELYANRAQLKDKVREGWEQAKERIGGLFHPHSPAPSQAKPDEPNEDAVKSA